MAQRDEMFTRIRGLVSRTPRTYAEKSLNGNDQPSAPQVPDETDPVLSWSSFLQSQNVPHVFWLEHVLVAYGSDTQVWELTLLVEEPTAASEILCEAGCQLCSHSNRFDSDAEFAGKGISMTLPGYEHPVTLYRATDWHFNLEKHRYGLPKLNEFLESLMDLWLNISSQDYVERLPFALHIASLITYCYRLQDPEHGPVNSINYASCLRKEYRELHLEIVAADRAKNFASTSRHLYHARRYWEIKNGDWNPPETQPKNYQLQLSILEEDS